MDPNTNVNDELSIEEQLSRGLYIAIELIGMFRVLNGDPRHSGQIRANVLEVAQWLDFLLDRREQFAKGPVETPEQLVLGGRVICQTCRDSGYRKSFLSTGSARSAAQVPLWMRQLDFLIGCTEAVRKELFDQACSSARLQFPDCLRTHNKVLMRLKRYLAQFRTSETNPLVHHQAGHCAACGRSMDNLLVVSPGADQVTSQEDSV